MSQRLTQPEELDRILRGLTESGFAAVFNALPVCDAPNGVSSRLIQRNRASEAAALSDFQTNKKSERGILPRCLADP